MKSEVITFGCRLNAQESQVIREHAEEAGVTNTIFVNTCAVTEEAVRQARQAIRRARKKNPEARIVVTGCAAQIEPAAFAALAEVDCVIGNAEKLDPALYRDLAAQEGVSRSFPLGLAPDFGIGQAERVRVNDIMQLRETAHHLVRGTEGRVRAFVQVQNGCNHRCTFCVIPYGRGNARSVPMGVVIEQIKKLVGEGYQEVVLTGVDLTSYGPDLPGTPSLGQLVQKILTHVPDLPRLRLSSLDSVEVDAELFEVIIGASRLMPHLHLSLQSGDPLILKRMKRRHLRDDAIAFCQKVRSLRPEIVLGADLIAGFPTETDEMFENSLRLVQECDLVHLHVFPYSPRPQTPAARMPQLARSVIKERAWRLREEGRRAFEAHLAQTLGRSYRVLIEKEGFGHTECFIPAHCAGGHPGEIICGQVISYTERALHLYPFKLNEKAAKPTNSLRDSV